MLMYLVVLLSAFIAVFLLGVNSKMMRDDRIVWAMIISWFICAAQYGLTWAIVFADLSVTEYMIFSGAGGSLGIGASQPFYNWLAGLKSVK
jgi:predicted AlkP superfamily pyrophosphatase or phosphodiesterase